jgi:hypothetical protein
MGDDGRPQASGAPAQCPAHERNQRDRRKPLIAHGDAQNGPAGHVYEQKQRRTDENPFADPMRRLSQVRIIPLNTVSSIKPVRLAGPMLPTKAGQFGLRPSSHITRTRSFTNIAPATAKATAIVADVKQRKPIHVRGCLVPAHRAPVQAKPSQITALTALPNQPSGCPACHPGRQTRATANDQIAEKQATSNTRRQRLASPLRRSARLCPMGGDTGPARSEDGLSYGCFSPAFAASAGFAGSSRRSTLACLRRFRRMSCWVLRPR